MNLIKIAARLASTGTTVKTVADLIQALQSADPNKLIGVSVQTSDDNFWSDPEEMEVNVGGAVVEISGYMSSGDEDDGDDE